MPTGDGTTLDFSEQTLAFLRTLPNRLSTTGKAMDGTIDVTGGHRLHVAPPPPELSYWMQTTGYAALSGGLLMGFAEARLRGLRYTVENAHQKPTSKQGWLLYHRRKNYTIALGFLSNAVRYGGRFALAAGVFFGIDVLMDWVQHRQRNPIVAAAAPGHHLYAHSSDHDPHNNINNDNDVPYQHTQQQQQQLPWWNGLVAGTTGAGGFSLWNGFRGHTLRHAMWVGAFTGAGYTLVQWLDHRYWQRKPWTYQNKYRLQEWSESELARRRHDYDHHQDTSTTATNMTNTTRESTHETRE